MNHTVEPARIEQITNYDLLKLEIWTDGTIAPAAALSQAARILIEHLAPVAQFDASATRSAPEIVAPTGPASSTTCRSKTWSFRCAPTTASSGPASPVWATS